jgi:hypothetical protein
MGRLFLQLLVTVPSRIIAVPTAFLLEVSISIYTRWNKSWEFEQAENKHEHLAHGAFV